MKPVSGGLRDEGEAYARTLDRAGVDVTSTRDNGLIHDYGLLNPISQVPGVRSAMLHASAELKSVSRRWTEEAIMAWATPLPAPIAPGAVLGLFVILTIATANRFHTEAIQQV